MVKFIPFSGEIAVDADRVDECMEAFEAWFDAFCLPYSCSEVGHPSESPQDEETKMLIREDR